MKRKKMLWFSRHKMSSAQAEDVRRLFGDVRIERIDRTVDAAYEIKDEIDRHDIIGIVMPIHLQEQTLRLAGSKPVIIARNHRIERGGEYEFVHAGWDRLKKIEVVKETLSDFPAHGKKVR